MPLDPIERLKRKFKLNNKIVPQIWSATGKVELPLNYSFKSKAWCKIKAIKEIDPSTGRKMYLCYFTNSYCEQAYGWFHEEEVELIYGQLTVSYY